MFREIRRTHQLLSVEETEALFKKCEVGVLSVIGDEGYPYGVPVSYVYDEGNIYFHSALVGHKIESLKKESKVSFTVVDERKMLPDKFTVAYTSAIAFGRAAVVESDSERWHAMRLINGKYSPNVGDLGEEAIKDTWSRFYVVKIQIEHMTGKEGIALAMAREGKEI